MVDSIRLGKKQAGHCRAFKCGYLYVKADGYRKRPACSRPWGKDESGKGRECPCMTAGKTDKHSQHLKLLQCNQCDRRKRLSNCRRCGAMACNTHFSRQFGLCHRCIDIVEHLEDGDPRLQEHFPQAYFQMYEREQRGGRESTKIGGKIA